VDFNELDEDDHLCSMLDYLSPGVAPLRVGLEVVVGDFEGNRGTAEVVDIQGRFVGLALKGDIERSDGTSCSLDGEDSLQYV
jgi:hypothetical protein